MRSLIRILSHVAELWPYYLAIVICSTLTAVTNLATPLILQRATDSIVAAVGGAQVAVTTIVWFAIALLIADLANTTISNIGGYLGDTMSAKLRTQLSSRYYTKLLSLPQRYFDNELTGTIIGRLSRSITEVTAYLQMFSNNFFPMLITVGAVLVISARYSILLAVLLVIIFPLYVWLTALTSTRWQRFEGAKNAELDLANGRFAEVIGQIRVVKSFTQEPRELGNFADRYRSTVQLTRTQSRWWHSMDALRRGLLNLVFFAVYVILFVQTLGGRFSIGTMVMLMQLTNMVRQPVTSMSYLVDSAQRAIAGSKAYFEVMNQTSERDPEEFNAALTADLSSAIDDAPMIEFRDVSFGYEPDNPVLRDLDFAIRRGERVALVSESGGGKSTLVSLLLGLYRPTSGTIMVAGRDTSELNLGQLREQTGVVFQEPALFSGTIKENIAYADPRLGDNEVHQAARRANADVFIRSFPQGYDSLVGERGLKLSGGQKQRIAVARAMVKDAPILVLDEATSALDTKSERLVQAGLDDLMAERTTIIIAHRLSTISSVDRIITFKDGRIDEIGSPAELARSGGIYAELLALQASTSRRDRRRLRNYGITI